MNLSLCLASGLIVSLVSLAGPLEPKFRAVTIDANIAVGYGITVADIDGDSRPDIVLCDAKQIVWYHNPGWEKHIITENLTPQDHVCVAAADIDGDGRAEIAVGAGWNPGDTLKSGALFYLIPPADRTQRWEPVTLPHQPTIHRIRWVREDGRGWSLWSVPLHGRGNKDAKGDGAQIQRYVPGSDRRQPWKIETVNDQWHKVHNFDPVIQSNGSTGRILVGSAEGAFEILSSGALNSARQIGSDANGGVGEIRQFDSVRGRVAALSPMHGNQVVVFHPSAANAAELGRREILDDTLIDAHALACGDLLGTGEAQIIAGWRAMGRPRSVKVGIALYAAVGQRWIKVLVDDDGMACEDLCLADLNGDGRLDIVASGRSTKNVKLYLNETRP